MHRNRGRLALALDAIAAAVAILLLEIVRRDGFVVDLDGLAIRFRTPDRTAWWLAALVAIRLVVDRHTPLFGVRWTFPYSAEPFHATSAGGWRRAVLASLAIGLGVAVLLHDQVASPYSVADRGDPLFSVWRMAWVNHQLGAEPARLFDANIFHPEPMTLALSDAMILPALMSAPLAAAGLHPIVVHNVLLFLGFWLSGVATYVLVERLTGSPPAAFLAGLIFACYSYRFDHYSHLELQMTQWIPLALLALHLLFVLGRLRYAVWLAIAGVAQLYSSMYYGVFLLVYAGVLGAGLWTVHRTPMRAIAAATVVAAVVAAGLSLPLARMFVESQPIRGDRPVEAVNEFSARPGDYLRTHKHSATWRGVAADPLPERSLFPGVVPIALGVIGLVPPLSPLRLVYVAGGMAAYDASLGFGGVLYPVLHASLPPVRGLRGAARFSILVGLTLAVLAGFGAMRLLRACQRRTANIVLAVLAAAVVADAWPELQLVPVWREPPPIYEYLPSTGDVVLADLPVLDDPGFNTPYQYFSLWHWKPMVGGYSGHIPQSYNELVPALRSFPYGDAPRRLRDRGVTHVTLNCGLRYNVPCEEIRRAMRASPELRIVRDARWLGEQVELYELRR